MTASAIQTTQHDSREDLLLIIDFQNIYLPGQEWACPTIEQSMANVHRIVSAPAAPDYVLTQYIASDDPVGSWKNYNEAYAAINADPYLCALSDGIRDLASEKNVIVKDTYSSLKSPQILERLKGKKRVVLSGVVAECCILATMMDAIDLGYEVIYLHDCISGMTPENERSIRFLAESFVPIHTQVMSAGEYIRSGGNRQ